MHTLETPSRSADVPGRALAGLVAAVAGLVVAFVVVPPRLAASGPAADLADHGRFLTAVRVAVVEYWQSGVRDHPPALQRVLDYWVRFHLVKGGIAALLLIAFGALSVVLWRTFLRAEGLGRGSRAALVSAGTVVPMLALFALAVVMANIQGAMAPFASLFPMLTESPPDGTADPDVAATLAQARQQLGGAHRTGGYTPPALDAMVSDFAWYHVALAVIAAVVAVALLGLSVMCWRRFARAGSTSRRTRRVWGWFGAFSAVSVLIMVVLLVANAGTATDPAPALLALFNGGF